MTKLIFFLILNRISKFHGKNSYHKKSLKGKIEADLQNIC